MAQPHGSGNEVFGLGTAAGTHGVNDTYDGRADNVDLDVEASEVDVADAGGYTSATSVEAALQEIYARLPYTIDQGDDLIIDTTVGDGSTLRDTSMVAPVLASTKYVVEATVIITGTANSGWKLGFAGPADATMVWYLQMIDVDNDFDQDEEQAITDSHGATAAVAVATVRMYGVLTVSTTAGNLSVQAAQNADHADDTIVHGESFLRVTKAA